MKRIIYHAILPAILPLLFFTVASTSVQVFGCRGRGLIALAITLISGIGAVVTIVLSIKAQKENPEKAKWWIVSTIMLTLPVVGMLILA